MTPNAADRSDELDVANLRNRIAASRKSANYNERMMVDVPTHVAEALLDALAAAEAARDNALSGEHGEHQRADYAEKERDALAARTAGFTAKDWQTIAGANADSAVAWKAKVEQLRQPLDALRAYLLNTGEDRVPVRLWTKAMAVVAEWEATPSEAGGEGRGT